MGVSYTMTKLGDVKAMVLCDIKIILIQHYLVNNIT